MVFCVGDVACRVGDKAFVTLLEAKLMVMIISV